jgi:hypothetical protein
MSTQAINSTATRPYFDAARRHEWLMRLMYVLFGAICATVAVYGMNYYLLPIAQRPASPLHAILRPSGWVGMWLGKLGLAMFLLLFMYAIRKRLAWLRRIGNNRRWLDFHVVLGISIPVIVTFHASFKAHGIAGVAFWIMWAVALSGFVGRYFYAQIPRQMNAAEMSLSEMTTMQEALTVKLSEQHLFSAAEIEPLLHVPTREEVSRMSAGAALWRMASVDLARPLLLGKLRRKSMSLGMCFASLGGLLPLAEPQIEETISILRRRAWLSTKISFLERVHQVFHLWHVIHRPFSYSLVALILIHIGTQFLLGYY